MRERNKTPAKNMAVEGRRSSSRALRHGARTPQTPSSPGTPRKMSAQQSRTLTTPRKLPSEQNQPTITLKRLPAEQPRSATTPKRSAEQPRSTTAPKRIPAEQTPSVMSPKRSSAEHTRSTTPKKIPAEETRPTRRKSSLTSPKAVVAEEMKTPPAPTRTSVRGKTSARRSNEITNSNTRSTGAGSGRNSRRSITEEKENLNSAKCGDCGKTAGRLRLSHHIGTSICDACETQRQANSGNLQMSQKKCRVVLFDIKKAEDAVKHNTNIRPLRQKRSPEAGEVSATKRFKCEIQSEADGKFRQGGEPAKHRVPKLRIKRIQSVDDSNGEKFLPMTPRRLSSRLNKDKTRSGRTKKPTYKVKINELQPNSYPQNGKRVSSTPLKKTPNVQNIFVKKVVQKYSSRRVEKKRTPLRSRVSKAIMSSKRMPVKPKGRLRIAKPLRYKREIKRPYTCTVCQKVFPSTVSGKFHEISHDNRICSVILKKCVHPQEPAEHSSASGLRNFVWIPADIVKESMLDCLPVGMKTETPQASSKEEHVSEKTLESKESISEDKAAEVCEPGDSVAESKTKNEDRTTLSGEKMVEKLGGDDSESKTDGVDSKNHVDGNRKGHSEDGIDIEDTEASAAESQQDRVNEMTESIMKSKPVGETCKNNKTEVSGTVTEDMGDEVSETVAEGKDVEIVEGGTKSKDIEAITKSKDIEVEGVGKAFTKSKGDEVEKVAESVVESKGDEPIMEYKDEDVEVASEANSKSKNDDAETISETLTESKDDDIEVVSETVTESKDDDVEVVSETVTESKDDDIEVVSETVTESKGDDIEVVSETVTESKDDDIEVVSETVTESKDDDIEVVSETVTESKDDDVEVVNETVTESKEDDIEVVNQAVTESKYEEVDVIESVSKHKLDESAAVTECKADVDEVATDSPHSVDTEMASDHGRDNSDERGKIVETDETDSKDEEIIDIVSDVVEKQQSDAVSSDTAKGEIESKGEGEKDTVAGSCVGSVVETLMEQIFEGTHEEKVPKTEEVSKECSVNNIIETLSEKVGSTDVPEQDDNSSSGDVTKANGKDQADSYLEPISDDEDFDL